MSSQAVDTIVEAISSAAKTAVENARFDVSSYGVVTSKDGDTYKIVAFGGEYVVTTSRSYTVGQRVVVTAMQKNFRNIILSEGNQSLEAVAVREISSSLDSLSSNVETIGNNLNNLVNQTESNNNTIQNQINQSIRTYYGHGVPSSDNYPATSWNNNWEYRRHENDIYYDIDTGKCYRWVKVDGDSYSWVQIIESGIVNALASAALAQTMAESKCRVFQQIPSVPYNVGDFWIQGNYSDLYVCTIARKASEKYSRNDWVKATKYTDDTTANAVDERVTALETMESEHYDELKSAIDSTGTNLDSFKQNDFKQLEEQVSANKTNIGTLNKSLSGLSEDVSFLSDNFDTFKTKDFTEIKGQTATNTENITSLNENLNTLTETEFSHYNELKGAISDITVDSMLESMGMAIDENGALCYIVEDDDTVE